MALSKSVKTFSKDPATCRHEGNWSSVNFARGVPASYWIRCEHCGQNFRMKYQTAEAKVVLPLEPQTSFQAANHNMIKSIAYQWANDILTRFGEATTEWLRANQVELPVCQCGVRAHIRYIPRGKMPMPQLVWSCGGRMRTWEEDGQCEKIPRAKRNEVAVKKDEEDPYNGSCTFAREFRLTLWKDGVYATYAKYPHLIPLISMQANGMNHCTGIDHAVHDAGLLLTDHKDFWIRVEALRRGTYNGIYANDCLLHVRDHLKFPQFHVDILTGEASAVGTGNYHDLGHCHLDSTLSTEPQQPDGPQTMAYMIQNKRLFVWISETTRNMPYQSGQWN